MFHRKLSDEFNARQQSLTDSLQVSHTPLMTAVFTLCSEQVVSTGGKEIKSLLLQLKSLCAKEYSYGSH